MGPVTTNPWLIALINMTIVFGVLIALGVMMSLLQVIDPTKKKVAKPAVAPTKFFLICSTALEAAVYDRHDQVFSSRGKLLLLLIRHNHLFNITDLSGGGNFDFDEKLVFDKIFQLRPA